MTYLLRFRSATAYKILWQNFKKAWKSFEYFVESKRILIIDYQINILNFLSIFAIFTKFIVPTDKISWFKELVLGRFLRNVLIHYFELWAPIIISIHFRLTLKLLLLRQIYEQKEQRKCRCFTLNLCTQLIQLKWNI